MSEQRYYSTAIVMSVVAPLGYDGNHIFASSIRNGRATATRFKIYMGMSAYDVRSWLSRAAIPGKAHGGTMLHEKIPIPPIWALEQMLSQAARIAELEHALKRKNHPKKRAYGLWEAQRYIDKRSGYGRTETPQSE